MAYSDLAKDLVDGLSDNDTSSVCNMCKAARDHIVIKTDDQPKCFFAGLTLNSTDHDGNNIPFGSNGCMLDQEDSPVFCCDQSYFNDIQYHKCEVIPCVVHRPSYRIFVMVGKMKHTKKLGSDHNLFEITLDITNTESLITHMDAFYFQSEEVSKSGITVGIGLRPMISFNNSTSNEVLYKRIWCAGLS